jgi:hypothetical protein
VNILARGVDDVNLFMENLEATGAFANVRPAEEHLNDQGLLESVLDMAYTPGGKPVTTGRGSVKRR